MGRFSQFGRDLRETEGCILRVSIHELLQKHGKNVIVIDGFNFYGQYLYPKFDWMCGSFRDLVEEIRNFVGAFTRIGVKLVFFFVEGHLDEGMDALGTETWVERQTDFLEYTRKLIRALSQQKKTLDFVKSERQYYHTPMDALSVVLYTLRHLLHCDVHLTYAGDRCDATAYFARNNDCLALLAQDYLYLFYEGIRCHLTFFKMNLEDMTFNQYCPNEYVMKKKLSGHFYPTFIELNSDFAPQLKELFLNILRKLEEIESVTIVRQKILEYFKGNDLQEVFGVDCEEIQEFEDDLCEALMDFMRFKIDFEYVSVQGPLEKWELIKLRAQELYESGQISGRIQHILMSKTFCNNCIVEDFVELPSSSLMYQPLRIKIYSVLFHEVAENEDIEVDEQLSEESDGSADDILSPGACSIKSKKLYGLHKNEKSHKGRQIYEWCILEKECKRLLVIPENVDPELHPGLLMLWNLNNTSDILDIKWKLFASCISSSLNCQLLRSLPPTLIVPTVVLYYMYNVVPLKFTSESWQFLQPWEVEVFMAQAVMLPKMDRASLSQINIANLNKRIVKLIASFVYGCHTMRLLIEVCGSFIAGSDLSLWNFFDGKLFHSFYEKSEWRRNAAHLCNKESITNFQIMKDIVLSESRGNAQRVQTKSKNIGYDFSLKRKF